MNDLKGIIEDCNKSDLVSDKVIKKIIEIIGQEEWQILHDENNDVCTTMGELIITLKGIAELEKACEETQELLDKQIEATYRLDKENAELKEKLKPENCLKLLAKEGYVKFTCENGNEHDQLTKAKEIIKKLYTVYYDPCVTESDLKYRDELFAEIKQFLSEVEK